MIAGIFHEGSGLGDQLFRYITVRTLAEEKGFDWGMVNYFDFKGNDIFPDAMNGNNYVYSEYANYKHWNEKNIRDAQENDIRSYDPDINFVTDKTYIDGSFEDSKYWGHNLENISKWLAVEPLNVSDDMCLIGFRGGEYYSDPNLGLPLEYFLKAEQLIYDKAPWRKFQVHTDDPTLAREFFPSFEIVDNQPISHSRHTNMALNWRTARFAKYAIIPNSAFFILPRLLKHFEDPTAVTIAPRYWAGHNSKIWKRPATFYKPFTYIHASDTN